MANRRSHSHAFVGIRIVASPGPQTCQRPTALSTVADMLDAIGFPLLALCGATLLALGMWAGWRIATRQEPAVQEVRHRRGLIVQWWNGRSENCGHTSITAPPIPERPQKTLPEQETCPGDGVLARLLAKTHRISQAHDVPPPSSKTNEEFRDSADELVLQLADVQAQLRQQSQQIESYMFEARTDDLTGLANRRAFDETTDAQIARRKSTRQPLSVLLIDVDLFKTVNDRFGHPAGDLLLIALGAQVVSVMRDADLVARYGGEEFAVLLPHSPLQEAATVAERIRRRIAGSRFLIQDEAVQITVSIGAAEIHSTEDRNDVARRADLALYSAKTTGRNAVYLHDGLLCQRLSPTSNVGNAAHASRD